MQMQRLSWLTLNLISSVIILTIGRIVSITKEGTALNNDLDCEINCITFTANALIIQGLLSLKLTGSLLRCLSLLYPYPYQVFFIWSDAPVNPDLCLCSTTMRISHAPQIPDPSPNSNEGYQDITRVHSAALKTRRIVAKSAKLSLTL